MTGRPRHSRRRRWIHRRGAMFQAMLRPPGSTGDRSDDGSDDGERSALVRISTTFGWPRPLPDWTGLAVRIFTGGSERDDESAGEHLDLLLASAATRPDLWCRLEAHRDVLSCSFTTAVRNRIDGQDQIVVAVPVDPRPTTTLDELVAGQVACPIRYRLDATEHRGSWRSLGELVLTEQHDRDDLGFRMAPPTIGPRWFTAVRRAFYRLAQGPPAR